MKDTRTVAEAVRFRRTWRPTASTVKMLRWVQVSPKGDRVVYQALGNLYVKRAAQRHAAAG